ncbi:MAG: protein kinase [Pirellulaceae bacterium]|nr:protein kinase [Pirellulaceae bacterium]
MSVCPSSRLIPRLSALGEEEYRQFEAHLEACPDCQRAVECWSVESDAVEGEWALAAEHGATVPGPRLQAVPLPPQDLRRIQQRRLLIATSDTNRSYPATPNTSHSARGTLAPPAMERYEFLEEIGRGGFGVVFRARHVDLNSDVAIKVVPLPAGASEADVHRLLREARVMSGVQHANVIRVFDVQRVDNNLCIVMELVRGESLADQMQRGDGLPPRAAAAMVRQLAEALDAVHRAGVVHGDVTPRNILLTRDSQAENADQAVVVPKLADFGLARELSGAMPATAGPSPAADQPAADLTHARCVPASRIMGTPNYMSPEQSAGQSLDARSDVFSLGIVLYELLTNDPLYWTNTADTLSVLADVQTRIPPPPSSLNHHIHRDLDAIALKCLQKQPGERYGTAGDLAGDLRRFLENKPIRAREVPASERFGLWLRRQPALAGLLAAALILLCGGAAFAGFVAITKSHEARTARQHEAQIRQRKQEGDRLLYASGTNQAERARQRKQRTLALQVLDGLRPERTDGGADYRNWEWYYLKRLCHGERLLLRGHEANVNCLAYNSDGTLLASGSQDCTARLWDARTGHQRQILRGHVASVTCLAFSADGQTLATGGFDARVLLWDVATGRQRGEIQGHILAINGLAFHASGTLLASAGADDTIQIHKLGTREPARVIIGFGGDTRCVTFSPDGSLLAAAGSDHRRPSVRVWEVASGRLLGEFAGNSGYIQFTGDGRRLLHGGQNDLRIVDIESGRVEFLLDHDSKSQTQLVLADVSQELVGGERRTSLVRPSGGFLSAELSRDETRVCTLDRGGILRIWDVATGRLLRQVSGEGQVFAWSPDGAFIAGAGDEHSVRVLAVEDDPQGRLLSGHVARVTCLDFSPDGRQVASGSQDQAIRIWDLATGRVVRTLGDHQYELGESVAGELPAMTGVRAISGHGGDINRIAYSPDGLWLASVSTDKTLRVWNAASGQEALVKRLGHLASCVAWSPDSRRLAAGSWDDVIYLIEFPAGATRARLAGHEANVLDVEFLNGGRQLASLGADSTLRVWDAESGRQVRSKQLANVSPTSRLAVSGDQKLLAISERNHVISLWNAADLTEVRRLWGHTGRVADLDFSSDGRRLISASGIRDDGTVKIWDVATGLELLSLPGIGAARFSPDGQRVAAGVLPNQIRVYDSTPLDDQPFRTAPWQPPAAAKKALADDGRLRVLGTFTVQRLEGFQGNPPIVSPDGEGQQFLVVAVSLPQTSFVLPQEVYERLVAESGPDDVDRIGPREGFALYYAPRFGLHLRDRDLRTAKLVGLWPRSSDAFGCGTYISLDSSDRLEPHERVGLAVAWALDPKEFAGPLRIQFGESEPVPVPDVTLPCAASWEPPPLHVLNVNRRVVAAWDQAKTGDYLAASADAAEVGADEELPAIGIYLAACVHGVALARLREDTAVPEEQREAKAEELAIAAIGLLRRALDRGFNDLQLLRTDEDLRYLHSRPDFKALLPAPPAPCLD